MPRLFLLDGTALAYRSHFALARSDLSTPDGRPTGATYGFTMTLRRILEQEAPERVAVAFDPPGRTFRHERYADYKATRQKVPDEMVAQLPWLREVVEAHGVPLYELPGYEADDVIGTLARQGAERGYEVFIVTGDKDFMQLVGPRVKLYNVFKREQEVVVEDEAAVLAKFGCPPERVVDVLAIMGDASDNVPGVKGIGEKGAIELIREFGSVEGLLAGLERVKGKKREHIERDRELLLLSRELVTIDTRVPLDCGVAELRPAQPDAAALRSLFARLGFVSLLKKVAAEPEPVRARRDYVVVRDGAGLEAMEAELRAAGRFALEAETTSLLPLEAELLGLAFSAREGRAFYVPLAGDPPAASSWPGGRAALLERLRPLLTDARLERVGHDTKHDDLVLAAHGLRLPPAAFDTLVASFSVAGSTRRHTLEELALHYLRIKVVPALQPSRGRQITIDQASSEALAEYACESAEIALRLSGVLAEELVERGAERLFRGIEMPLVPVLVAMEERGIRLDTALLAAIGTELEAEMERHVRRLRELAGGVEVNPNSTKALGELLFEKLRIQDQAGVKRPKATKTGWATDYDTLSLAYGDVPIVQALLEYREVQKLKSTYVDALPRYVNARTGRVHCCFSQVSAATGRLATSEPNLQNVPIRTERGRRLRAAFIAHETDARGPWHLISADYSQVELRIMAHLSGDERLRAAFAEGKDIHTTTAAVVAGVAEALVTREMRSRAKAINYGLLYGMGPARLARETGLSLAEARRFIERYFAGFPKVAAWRENLLAFVRQHGYVETLMGRRRSLADIGAEAGRERASAENAALNTPLQGSAAEIVKLAMIALERRLAESGLAARLLLQVHDELLLEAPLAEVDATIEIVRDCMEHAFELSVPLSVDVGHGVNWLEAH